MPRTGSHCRFGCVFDEQCLILHAWFLVFACVLLPWHVLQNCLFSKRLSVLQGCVECLALARTADLDAFLMNSASFCMHGFLCLHVSYCLGTCCKIVCFRSVFLCCRHTALVLFRHRLDPFACFDTCILESLRCAVRAFLCSCCCVCFSTDACLGRLPYSLFFWGLGSGVAFSCMFFVFSSQPSC